jgi:hypothetical protein
MIFTSKTKKKMQLRSCVFEIRRSNRLSSCKTFFTSPPWRRCDGKSPKMVLVTLETQGTSRKACCQFGPLILWKQWSQKPVGFAYRTSERSLTPQETEAWGSCALLAIIQTISIESQLDLLGFALIQSNVGKIEN